MDRLPDWPQRLQHVLEHYEGRPFKWGESDCAHFAGDCVQAVTGECPLGLFRGAYENRLGAKAGLLRRKFKSLAGAAAEALEALGCTEGLPPCSMVGDVGVTADGVLCVRFPAGFIARGDDGKFYEAVAVRSWCVAWPKEVRV